MNLIILDCTHSLVLLATNVRRTKKILHDEETSI